MLVVLFANGATFVYDCLSPLKFSHYVCDNRGSWIWLESGALLSIVIKFVV